MASEKTKSDLSNKLISILNEIDRSPSLRLIMKRLLTPGSPLGRLFLSNSAKVFVAETLPEPMPDGTSKITLPVLFWTSAALMTEPGDRLSHLATLLDLKKESLETSRAEWSAILDHALDEKGIRDLLSYYCLKFARSSTKTKDLVSAPDFSFRTMQKALGDAGKLDTDEFFYELNNSSSSNAKPGADLDVMHVVEKIKTRFLTSLFENPMATILNDAPVATSVLLDQLASRPFHYVRDLEESAHLASQDYQNCLNELYDLKTLTNVESVFWCANREHEPVMMTTKASLGPLASGPNCPKCHNPTNYSTAYKLHPTITDSVSFPGGGFLTILMGWNFRMKPITFLASQSIEGNEMDFLIDVGKNKWLIECKMHSNNMEPETLIQAWKKDLRKVDKKVLILDKQGYHIQRKILVYNWPHSSLYDATRKGPRVTENKRAGIELMGYDAFFEEIAKSD